MVEGAFQLQSATADVFQIFAEEADGGVGLDLGSSFVELLIVDENLASEDQSLRTFARSGEAAVYQEFVETGFQGQYSVPGTQYSVHFSVLVKGYFASRFGASFVGAHCGCNSKVPALGTVQRAEAIPGDRVRNLVCTFSTEFSKNVLKTSEGEMQHE